MTNQKIRINEHLLHVQVFEAGHRKNLILVHGIGASSRYWLPLAKVLKHLFNLYILDFPGHGKSTKPKNALSLQELADILNGLIVKSRHEEIILVGNSYGCQIIIDMMYRYNDHQINKIVLLGPTINKDERSTRVQILRWVQNGLSEPLWIYPILFRDFLSSGIKRMLQSLRYAILDCPEQKIKAINTSILVIRGSKDPIVTKQWTNYLTNEVKKVQKYELKNKGHIIHMNAVKQTANLITDYCNSK